MVYSLPQTRVKSLVKNLAKNLRANLVIEGEGYVQLAFLVDAHWFSLIVPLPPFVAVVCGCRRRCLLCGCYTSINGLHLSYVMHTFGNHSWLHLIHWEFAGFAIRVRFCFTDSLLSCVSCWKTLISIPWFSHVSLPELLFLMATYPSFHHLKWCSLIYTCCQLLLDMLFNDFHWFFYFLIDFQCRFLNCTNY